MQYQYDVGIILGGGRNSNDELNARSIARLDKAIELFRSRSFPRMILSGGISFSAPEQFSRSEGSLMREYVNRKGIADDVLYVEEHSTDTLGNAYFCREQFLDRNAWYSLLVITSAFHVDRSSYLLKKVLGSCFRVDFAACSTLMPSEEAERLRRLECHIKDIYGRWLDTITDGDSNAIADILFKHHPGHAPNPDYSREQFIRLLYGDIPP